MKKRTLCWILALVMVFSLLPSFALAEETPAVDPDKTYSDPNWSNSGGLNTHKTLQLENDGTYTITMEAYAEGQVISQTLETGYPLDIAIVVDQSGSMIDEMPAGYQAADQTSFTPAQIAEGSYYIRVGDEYYPVQGGTSISYGSSASRQYVRTLVPSSAFNGLSNGNTSTSYVRYFYPTGYAIKVNNTYHQVYANLFKQSNYYYVILYYFNDESEAVYTQTDSTGTTSKDNFYAYQANPDFYSLYQNQKVTYLTSNTYSGQTTSTYTTIVNGVSSYNNNSPSTQTGSSLYKIDSTYSDIYYVDGNNETQTLASAGSSYSGTLYTATTAPRYQVLQQAVTDFCQTVADKAEYYGTEHKIALIGFAGNEVPSTSVSNGVYHYSGDNRNWDYANTGLFIGSDFINYETITGYTPMDENSSYYRNYHYFIDDGNGNKIPILYDSSAGRWYKVSDGYYCTPNSTTYGPCPAYTTTSSGNSYQTRTYYKANYRDLTVQNYRDALVSASTGQNGTNADGTPKGTVNTSLTQSIANFGCYGGTYTSYGLAMANQVFANNTEQRRCRVTDSEGNVVNNDLVTPLKVIILFTDGEPGGSGYDPSIAGEAIADAAYAKQTFNAQVYALGLFSDTPSEQVTNFMESVSSESYMVEKDVAWADLDPTQVYFFYNSYEDKTYSVSTQDGTDPYIIYEGKGITKYEPTTTLGGNSSNYWGIQEPGYTNYYSYLYTSSNGGDNNRVSKNTALDRNRIYYAYFGTDEFVGYKNGQGTGDTLVPVTYDYYWKDSNGYVTFAERPNDLYTGHHQFFQYETLANSDSTEYYFTVQDAYGLTARFNAIANEIQAPVSMTTIGSEDSFLRDEITSDFNVATPSDASNVTVSIEKGVVDGEGKVGWTAVTTQNATTDETAILSGITKEWESGKAASLKVTGFDYGANYVSAGHDGYKLVVKITGLLPEAAGEELASNTAASGIYKTEGEGDDATETLVTAFTNPYATIKTAPVIIDYNVPVKLGALGNDHVTVNGVGADTSNTWTATGKSGDYKRSNGDLIYQLKTATLNPVGTPASSTTATDVYNVTIGAYAGVDHAVMFSGGVWKDYASVPASAVYYDDDIAAATKDASKITGLSNSSVIGETAATTGIDGDKGKQICYTFTGTGIDVYSTTLTNGKYVIAQLLNADGTTQYTYPTGSSNVSSMMMLNKSAVDRYNVPSVFFHDLPYGTYVLKLYAPKGADYRLDGIRVYNPAGTVSNTTNADQTADANELYESIDEQNATFTNLRELLIESPSAIDVATENAGVAYFFTDKGTEQTVTFNGTDVIKYNPNTVDAYTIDGPKNELYLESQKGIAFTIQDWATLKAENPKLKLMVGLSAPNVASTTESVTVTVTDDNSTTDHKITTPMDMYYEIAPDANGNVMIKNASAAPTEGTDNNLVAVTNFKVSGAAQPITIQLVSRQNTGENKTEAKTLSVAEEQPATTTMRLVVTEDTLAYAEQFDTIRQIRALEAAAAEPTPSPDPTPDPKPVPTPTPTPSVHSVVQQIISSFVRSLFSSISRLFGF